MTRKLAYIAKIEEIIAIDGADRIVQYRVLGWKVIDQKDKYQVGDLVVYVEADAWMPHTLAPFLTKLGHFPKTYNGIEGQRLKTIKLKGAMSQGLLLPVEVGINAIEAAIREEQGDLVCVDFYPQEGDELDDALGIIKWEPEPEKIPTNAKGNFPSFIPKTDQERCISAGTMIETTFGFMPIEEIVNNKLNVHVKAFNHSTNTECFARIVDHSVMRAISEKWIKFTLEDGTTLTVTDNHRVWCDSVNAYREAKHITVGDYFIQKTE